MKILYLNPDHGVPVLGRKGCSTHVREVCRALALRGHEVVCLTALAGEDGELSDQSLPFDLLELPGFRARWMGADLRHVLYNLRLRRGIKQVMRSFEPDLMYERYALYATAGQVMAARAGVPHMLEVNTFLAREQARRLHLPRMAAWWEGAIWRGADALVAVSSPLGRDLVQQGFAVRPERLRVMPMAVDTARFFPRAAPRADTPLAPHVPPDWCAVIYSGALTAWHGIESFFGIAEEFRSAGDPIKLIALGGEALHVKKYAASVEERGLGQHLSFVGSVPHAQVPEWLAAADVGFIAHTSEYSSPTKMFEYMASGLPVVAPDLPAIREVLGGDETMGALFDGSEAGAVAALRLLAYGGGETCTKQVDGGAGLRQERGQAARQAAEDRHSWDSVAKSIEAFYGDLVRR